MLAYLSSIAPSCRTLDQWFPDEALAMLQKSFRRPQVFVSQRKNDTIAKMLIHYRIGQCHKVTATSIVKDVCHG